MGHREKNLENNNDDKLIDRDYIFDLIKEFGGKDVLENVKQV